MFRNIRDEITECAIHNMIVSIGGCWLTPPILSGLLPGVYRRRMLREGRVSERLLSVRDLLRATEVYVCNSVRGLHRVIRIDEQSEKGGASVTIWIDRELADHPQSTVRHPAQ